MSSSSPPRNPSPASSGSASPDFEYVEPNEEDVDDQEIASQPQLDPNLVYSPQPIASYDPNQPHLPPSPIPSFNPNLAADISNICSDIDPEFAKYLKSQGIVDTSDPMHQGLAFDFYNPPESLNVYPEIDEETANLMKEQGINMFEMMRQRQALEYFNRTKQFLPQDPAGISTTQALVQGKKSGMRTMKERARRGSEAQIQDSNATDSADIEDCQTERPMEKPVAFKEPDEPIDCHEEDDDGEFDHLLFDSTENEAEDDYHTLKLFVRLKRNGEITAPKHVVKDRFKRKQTKLEAKYRIFMKEYGKRLLSKDAFSSKLAYQMYRMSRFIWGNHVIQSDGCGSSIGVDGSFYLDDYKDCFDPNAPFYHPDMKCYPYDPDYDPKKDNHPHTSQASCHDPGVVVDPNGPSVSNGSNASVVKVDPNGSYLDPNEELEPDDPYFDDDVDVPILERIKACFGSLDPIPAPVTRVTAAGQKVIVKAPQLQTANVNSGRDRELEAVTTRASAISLGEVPEDREGADFARAIEISLGKVPEDTKGERVADQIDTVPLNKRNIDTLAGPFDKKQSKRRKLLESPPNALPEAGHQMQQEEENMLLLPYSDNVEDDDYATLKFLMLCPLQQTFTLYRGFLQPNFENSLAKLINGILPSRHQITTGQCKMKVSSLFKKFFKFRELNGDEDLSEADFCVHREYEMYKMFKTLWVDGPESGRSGSAGGSELDPNPPPVKRVSAAGTKFIFKAPKPQAVNVKSGRDGGVEADMETAIALSLQDVPGSGGSGSGDDPDSFLKQGLNVGNVVQGGGGNLKDFEMNVDPGKNMDAGNVGDPGADDDQVNLTNIAVDGGQENVDKMAVDGSLEK